MLRLAFPDNQHFPAKPPQFPLILLISPYVLGELLLPEIRIVFGNRKGATFSVAMLEAAVYEKDLPVPWQDHIWLSRKTRIM